MSEGLETLLGPLCDATDALARLDARAAAVGENIRNGLIARMAFAEAAGWLAHAHAWVHPLDLALRAHNLAGSTAPAVIGHGTRVLPHTFARGETAWEDQTVDVMADADAAVATALVLAHTLPRLATSLGRDMFADVTTAQDTLAPFAVGPFDPQALADWRAAWPPTSATPRRRFSQRGEGVSSPLPPLLAAARVAAAWMAAGIVARPTPLVAGLAAVSLLARRPARVVFVPLWAAYPAVGFGERNVLPRLRSDVADRLVGWNQPITWPLAFLHLVAEGARAGLRDLDRLETAAEQGRGLCTAVDRRSRLPDAIDALLRVPVLTPKALATRLKVAPQTGTSLLRELVAKGLVREVTGRGSFRAFAI